MTKFYPTMDPVLRDQHPLLGGFGLSPGEDDLLRRMSRGVSQGFFAGLDEFFYRVLWGFIRGL